MPLSDDYLPQDGHTCTTNFIHGMGQIMLSFTAVRLVHGGIQPIYYYDSQDKERLPRDGSTYVHRHTFLMMTNIKSPNKYEGDLWLAQTSKNPSDRRHDGPWFWFRDREVRTYVSSDLDS